MFAAEIVHGDLSVLFSQGRRQALRGRLVDDAQYVQSAICRRPGGLALRVVEVSGTVTTASVTLLPR